MTGMDQSWWNTPFLLHHRIIKTEQEITTLRQSGVKIVEIDTTKGRDVEDPNQAQTGLSDFPSEGSVHGGGKEEPSESFHDIATASDGLTPLSPAEPDPSTPSTRISDPDIINEPTSQEFLKSLEIRNLAIQAVEKIFEGVVTGVPIKFPLLQEATKSVVQHITDHSRSMAQVVLLQNLRAFDKNLFQHVVDVCVLAVMVGWELGWSEEELHELGTGALLHDIGYMRLPANLLHQRQKGLPIDIQLMDQHMTLGVSLATQCQEISSAVGEMIRDHHERLDGSGKPGQVMGSDISEAAKLIGLLDSFDTKSSRWGAIPQQSSAHVLRRLYSEAKSGIFEVHVVERLIRCLGIYPVGSFVELSTGERGVVSQVQSDDLLKPIIKIIGNSKDELYPTPFLVNLADPKGEPPRQIEKLLEPADHGIQVGKFFSVMEVPC